MATATTSAEIPQLQLDDELENRIKQLLGDRAYMSNLVKTMSVFGHDKWLHLGASEAALKSTSNESIKTAALSVIGDGWNAFVKSLDDSVEGGGTLPVFCADFKDATLSVESVIAVTNSMYSSLPASESYKFVGDQYETQVLLKHYLKTSHGKGTEALDAAVSDTGKGDDALLVGDWTWASASGVFVSAQYYRDLFNK